MQNEIGSTTEPPTYLNIRPTKLYSSVLRLPMNLGVLTNPPTLKMSVSLLNSKDIRAFLASRLSSLNERLLENRIRQIIAKFQNWQMTRDRELKKRERQVPKHARQKWRDEVYGARRQPERFLQRQLINFLVLDIDQNLRDLDDLSQNHDEFRSVISLTPTEAERQRVMLEFARKLGASTQDLRGDAKAFGRWFTADAISERFFRKEGQHRQLLVFEFERLGQLVADVLQQVSDVQTPAMLIKRLDIERLVVAALKYEFDARIRVAALQCLVTALSNVHIGESNCIVSPETEAKLVSLATDKTQDVWLQSAALELLCLLALPTFHSIAKRRMSEPGTGDDFFVRRRIVEYYNRRDPSSLVKLLPVMAKDPSAYVRQKVGRLIWNCEKTSAREWLQVFAREDSSPIVRASVLAESARYIECQAWHPSVSLLLSDVFDSETDETVISAAIDVSSEWIVNLLSQLGSAPVENTMQPTSPNCFLSQVLPKIQKIQHEAKIPALRLRAANALEQIWSSRQPEIREFVDAIVPLLAKMRSGQGKRLPASMVKGLDQDQICRALAALAQNDFGFQLSRKWYGYKLWKGPVFGFRWWRFLYEMTHPSTDKRQAFPHTVGRIAKGNLQIPSGILAEVSQTKVPGEPLLLSTENSWRPYLPLVDDFVSVLCGSVWKRPAFRFFTSQGITTVKAPWNPVRRLTSYIRLTATFSRVAELRNWQEGSAHQADEYIRHMQRLGFEVGFSSYNTQENKTPTRALSVPRSFPTTFAIAGLPILDNVVYHAGRYRDYFSSAFENTLSHLAIYIMGVIALMVFKHGLANWFIRRARRSIPLVVGGWGTRGKSGTERLKAALFSHLGCGIVSKSSGCEAMFLQSHAHGILREIPLFRPYDKATIWEHSKILKMASRLNPDVFLWECMGLNSDYVSVLQHHWSKDDISTITNAYPDHEDIQGPAGHDVAQVISGFAPIDARLLTTEKQMLPLIAQACRRHGSSLKSTNWLDSALITNDVLNRFPYQEHPENIALVLALADEIDCPEDVALKAMADEMIPDLGVLKTFPGARLQTRTLEFTNGMSANERFGCLGNWQRLEFDKHDPNTDPATWICTIVNNRADRVARSRVFASMLVKDLQADRHFLIGTNLKGMVGYVLDAWDAEFHEISLWPKGEQPSQDLPLETLATYANKYRQAIDEDSIRKALKPSVSAVLEDASGELAVPRMIESILDLWPFPVKLADRLREHGVRDVLVDATQQFAIRLLDGYQKYEKFKQQVSDVSSDMHSSLDREFRSLCREWFQSKFVIIENSGATGEQIIQRIIQETPPGYRNRSMGIQNIKGTGIDFVYTWEAWNEIHTACQFLESQDRRILKHGLHLLAGSNFGQLAWEHVDATLNSAKRDLESQADNLQAEIDSLQNRLKKSKEQLEQQLSCPLGRSKNIKSMMKRIVVSFSDAQAAIQRRVTANRIYRDLENQRVSQQRAVDEIRNLNRQQKPSDG